ncbi:MAG: PEGA domain-containing protein [Proteobacteria bacterium]|nr:PEGA domain-containing protein [Pseudomonadota bacterium]
MFWLTTVALAAKLPEVAVVGLHIDGLSEEDAQLASAEIGEALTRTQVMTYIEPQFASAKLQGREELVLADMALGSAMSMLEEGRVLYGRAEPDEAIPLLQDAVRGLEEGIPATGQTADLLDAYLLLALAQTGMGELDAARAAYREVVTLDPSRELDPISYPPDVVDAYVAVRADVMASGTGVLRVQADGEEVEVIVDGQSVGLAPVAINDLPAGVHHVYATADGGLRAYQRVEISTGAETVSLSMARTITEPADTPSGMVRQTDSLYRSIGAYSQTPLVLLGGEVGDDQVAVLLYSSRSENFSQALVAPRGSDPARSIADLIPALGSYVTETGDIRSDRVAITAPPLDVSDNALLTQILLDPNEEIQVQYIETGPKWYVWAAMGGVAAAGAGVGVWAVVFRDPGGTEPTDDGTITVVLPD